MKKCPNCAEEIQNEAKVCIHCGREVYEKFFTEGMVKLIVFAVCFLIVAIWLGGVEQKSFGTDSQQKTFNSK